MKECKKYYKYLSQHFQSIYNDNKGFTVIELIVAMGIIGLVAMFAYSTYVFAIKGTVNWRKRVDLENSAHIIINSMANDILAMREFKSARKNEIKYINNKGQEINFCLKNNNLLKNKKIINKKNLLIESLVFDFATYNHNNKLNFKRNFSIIDENEFKSIALIKISLIVANNKNKFSVQTAVTPRNRKHDVVQKLAIGY